MSVLLDGYEIDKNGRFFEFETEQHQNLIPCVRCGGTAQHYALFDLTAFGASRFVGVRCKNCKAATTSYMDDTDRQKISEETLKEIDSLWNRGIVGRGEIND